MPRRIFPASTVTNTTGAPLRLTFYATSTTNRRETDLSTVDASNNLVERIPNGVVLTDVTGAYSAFAGPDDIDTLYALAHNGTSRTEIGATDLVGSASSESAIGLPRSNGANDTTAINAILTAASGKTVRGIPGQNYLISAPLVVKTGTTLDMTNCTVTLIASSNCNMVTNYSSLNAVATAADAAVASGSAVVTTALASRAVVGQTLTVTAAGGNGYGELIGLISAVNTGAGTITLTKLDGTTAATATATVSGAAVILSNRDTGIKIRGGSWQRGANGPNNGTTRGTGTAGHSFFLRHIDNLVVDIDEAVSTAGISFIWPTDVRGFDITVRKANVVRTAVQLVGPAYAGRISYVRGTSTDDLVTICGNVYPDQTNTAGDVIDVTVGEVIKEGVSGGGGSTLKLNAGQGYTIDAVQVGRISGWGHIGVNLGEDGNHAETTAGTYGFIDLGYIDFAGDAYALFLTNPVASRIKAKVKCITAGTVQSISSGYPTVGATIDTLELQLDSYGGGAALNSTINNLILDKCRVVSSTSGAHLCDIHSGTINKVTVNDAYCLWTGKTDYGVYQSGSSVVNYVEVKGGYFSAGAAVVRTWDGGTCNVKVSGVRTSGMDRLANLRGTTTLDIDGVDCTNNGNAAIFAKGPLTIHGGRVTLTTGSTTLLQRNTGGDVVNVKNPQIQVDLAQLAAVNGGMVYNTNASSGPGVGLAFCDGTTWRNASGFVKSGTATLAGGTVTVSDTAITANSVIRVANKTVGGTPGALYVSAKTASTSFVITSSSGTDTSVVQYDIVTY